MLNALARGKPGDDADHGLAGRELELRYHLFGNLRTHRENQRLGRIQHLLVGGADPDVVEPAGQERGAGGIAGGQPNGGARSALGAETGDDGGRNGACSNESNGHRDVDSNAPTRRLTQHTTRKKAARNGSSGVVAGEGNCATRTESPPQTREAGNGARGLAHCTVYSVFAALKICSANRLFGAAKPSKPFSVTRRTKKFIAHNQSLTDLILRNLQTRQLL